MPRLPDAPPAYESTTRPPRALCRGPAFAPRGRAVLTIDGDSLTVEEVVRVARRGEAVRISAAAMKRIRASRAAVDAIVQSGTLAYGIKTGFGQLETVAIPEADVIRLQQNLVRSHAVGVGAPLPEDEVRAALLVRANALVKGYSGIRPAVAQLLVDMLDRGVVPVVPAKGSLGASGDLAPLAHIALVMMGEGQATVQGQMLDGRAALRAAKLAPIRFESKEGLAVTNGTAVMAGLGCLLVSDATDLLRDAQIAAAMSFEALRASPQPYDERISRVKRHVGQHAVAANMLRLLEGSEIIPSHKGPHKVQDAYSLRCIPQVLGAVYETVAHARAILEIEVNSATDNPLIFPDPPESLSGGNFHGQSAAMALDFLALGLTVLANLAERRVARLVDTHLSDLPPFLTERSGLNSGMMLLQYTAAALASENKVLAHPATADTIPTSANQEDFVSMGQSAALKAREVLANARRVVAIEYLCAAQGLEFLLPLKAGVGPRTARQTLRTQVPRLTEDRPQSDDIEAVVRLMRDGAIASAVESKIGKLLSINALGPRAPAT